MRAKLLNILEFYLWQQFQDGLFDEITLVEIKINDFIVQDQEVQVNAARAEFAAAFAA